MSKTTRRRLDRWQASSRVILPLCTAATTAALRRLSRACLPASVVGFFDGAVQPHLDQMQHAPIDDPTRHRL